VRPSFKFPIRGAASQRCARHKLPGMVGNSGKLSFPASPVLSESNTPGDEFKATTPKRPRGELLKIQREQMVQILGDSGVTNASADSETKADVLSPHSALAASCKRIRNFASLQNSNFAELATNSSVCQKACAQVALKNAPDTLPAFSGTPANAESSAVAAKGKCEGVKGGNVQPFSLLTAASESGILHLQALLAAQHNAAPLFTPQQPGSFAVPALPEFQRTLQSEALPVNMNAPIGSMNSAANFNQALHALSAFNASLWAPMMAMNTLSTPSLPTFNPWANSALPLSPSLEMSHNASLTLNPSLLSTQNIFSQFPQVLANLSADMTTQTAVANLLAAMPIEKNNAPRDTDLG
jgi:hypothetical protein